MSPAASVVCRLVKAVYIFGKGFGCFLEGGSIDLKNIGTSKHLLTPPFLGQKGVDGLMFLHIHLICIYIYIYAP